MKRKEYLCVSVFWSIFSYTSTVLTLFSSSWSLRNHWFWDLIPHLTNSKQVVWHIFQIPISKMRQENLYQFKVSGICSIGWTYRQSRHPKLVAVMLENKGALIYQRWKDIANSYLQWGPNKRAHELAQTWLKHSVVFLKYKDAGHDSRLASREKGHLLCLHSFATYQVLANQLHYYLTP